MKNANRELLRQHDLPIKKVTESVDSMFTTPASDWMGCFSDRSCLIHSLYPMLIFSTDFGSVRTRSSNRFSSAFYGTCGTTHPTGSSENHPPKCAFESAHFAALKVSGEAIGSISPLHPKPEGNINSQIDGRRNLSPGQSIAHSLINRLTGFHKPCNQRALHPHTPCASSFYC